jgi:hypothetical protein
MRFLAVVLILGCRAPHASPPSDRPARVALRIDAEEANVVLDLIAAPSEAGWSRLFASEGFHRLVIREHSLHRSLEETDMRALVASPDVIGARAALTTAVAKWSTVDLDAIARRVLSYLPADATLHATIYPVIKPKPNSFVNFDDFGAAIFVSVDPTVSAADFANTIAHELHHIGFSSIKDAPCDRAPPVCLARKWSGGFGEGFAMLAAAGGPDIDPQATSSDADRVRWNHDVAEFDADLPKVQAMLQAIVAGALDADQAEAAARQFYGVQGPWYTLGWVMASSIERCFGRARLVDAMRSPWTVMGTWNEVRATCPTKTGSATATWDSSLVDGLR